MIIAVDFDGTVVEHEYPKIGKSVPGAIRYLSLFQDTQAKLILWTMRSGPYLSEAAKYLNNNGIELYGVNENPDQYSWTKSNKAYAQIYIDDAAFGCPLVYPPGRRPYVDWDEVGPAVLNMIITGMR